MVNIDSNLRDFILKKFPDRTVKGKHHAHSWQSSRWLYVTTVLTTEEKIHYEYLGGRDGRVELHLEGKYLEEEYRDFRHELYEKTRQDQRLRWKSHQGKSLCACEAKFPINGWGELVEVFRQMMNIFDPLIEEANRKHEEQYNTESYTVPFDFNENLKEEQVCMLECCLGQLLTNSLIIPDYQRNYCWEDKEITALWNSLKEIPNEEKKYHLGTIILQKLDENKYAVIDGQQRLVTLALILRGLNYNGPIPLLGQTFRSKESDKHVSNCKWLIKQLKTAGFAGDLWHRILYNLSFSVLILTESRLDLAYTFFSNENSKGVPLSDFDILKAHHLRYIHIEEQAEHMAIRWNNTMRDKKEQLNNSIAKHLFRMRKWIRKRYYNPNAKRIVKDEFSASLIIPEIPPFGESFNFNEKIQGGTHFFAYIEFFVNKYERFSSLRQVKELQDKLQWESHWRYADVIETLLFAYYLKFGDQYLTDALFCIASVIAQHRYQTNRAITYKIQEYAMNSEIVMMIEQATSPTFFLAECLQAAKVSGRTLDDADIKMRFYHQLQKLFEQLSDELTEPTITKKYRYEY
jgi:hypothetical protein